jgi:recombination protein RecT
MAHNLEQRIQAQTAPDRQRPATLADQIKNMESQFALAMPKGAEAQQLVRDALTALRQTPNLSQCTPATVLGSLMTCAQLGLRPGVLGHAYLVPFKNKSKGVMEAQLVIGYQGLVELAHRSGQIKSLIARTVYENDFFDVDYGLDDKLVHKPYLGGDKGQPIAYYAVAKFNSGGHAFFVMSHPEMIAYRDRHSKTPKWGPWADHFEAMAHKTCYRQLSKWMPKSTEMAQAIAADETVRVDLTPSAIDHPAVIDGDTVEAPQNDPQQPEGQ